MSSLLTVINQPVVIRPLDPSAVELYVQAGQGPSGPPGATGSPGPNSITSATATNLTGILYGNGSDVGVVTIGAGLSLVNGTLTNTASASAVTSVAGRTGAVVLTTSDIGGLGSAALQNSTAFDAAGSAAAALASAESYSSNASNLTSGTVAINRLSGITSTQLSATAGITNAQLANSSVTIAGSAVALGASITQDAITGLSSTGIVKRSGANALAIAVAGDFPVLNQSTTGNSATTTKLATARNIAGVAFDGTSDIAISAGGLSNGTTGSGSIVLGSSPALSGVPTAPTATGGTNTVQIATTAFVTSAVANAVTNVMTFGGTIACASNPNYPAATAGSVYYVSSAGKIGGASGVSVDVGDALVCITTNAGGTQAAVGSSWDILEHNLVGALLSANNLSDVANQQTALNNLSGGVTSGYYLRGNGTNVSMSALQASDLTGTITNAQLAGSIAASKLIGTDITTVGTLTTGATGTGFTVALGTSTITGTLPAANHPALTGDITSSAGSTATTLAASGVVSGSYGGSSAVPVITFDGKGRATSASSATYLGSALGGTSLASGIVTSSLTSTGTLSSGSAASGFTVADACLTSNVALKNASNTFTGVTQTLSQPSTGSALVINKATGASGRFISCQNNGTEYAYINNNGDINTSGNLTGTTVYATNLSINSTGYYLWGSETKLTRGSAGVVSVSDFATTGGTGVAGLSFSSQDATALQTLGTDTHSWSSSTDSSRLARRIMAVNSYGGSQTFLTAIAGTTIPSVTLGGIVIVTNNAGAYLKLPTMTVGQLTAASTAGLGAMAAVTDATATTAGTTPSGGGANSVYVRSNGSSWIIF